MLLKELLSSPPVTVPLALAVAGRKATSELCPKPPSMLRQNVQPVIVPQFATVAAALHVGVMHTSLGCSFSQAVVAWDLMAFKAVVSSACVQSQLS